MTSKPTKTGGTESAGDARNQGFGGRQNVIHHKPGFESGHQRGEPETRGNHAFRRSEQKDVPQESLAERVGRRKQGG
jgi:hypothetical protein